MELSRESLPGTEQNTSLGFITTPINPSFWQGRPRALFFVNEIGPAEGGGKAGILYNEEATVKVSLKTWSQTLFHVKYSPVNLTLNPNLQCHRLDGARTAANRQ